MGATGRAAARRGEPAQGVLDGMPRRLYPCTPTRLSTWLDCPRRYRMTYLDRPPPAKGPPWAHNSFGASVHNALAGWWRLPLAQRTVAAAAALLNRGWIDEGYASDEQSAQHRDQAHEMVTRYTANLDPRDEPLGVERTVGAHTARIVLSGRIDRLDARRTNGAAAAGLDPPGAAAAGVAAPGVSSPGVAAPGVSSPGVAAPGLGEAGPAAAGDTELVVVDYKTGRRRLSADDARSSLPLAMYALAAARIFHRPCRRVELHHLPTGEVHAWEHTEQTVDRHVRRAEGIAAECEQADERFRARLAQAEMDAVFPPRPSPSCGWCDFRSACPEGSAAGPAHRPWDGLAG